MFTKFWWKDTLERSLSTAAQSLVLVVGADQLDAFSAPWEVYLGFTLGGFVLSLVKSVAAYKKDSNVSPASLA